MVAFDKKARNLIAPVLLDCLRALGSMVVTSPYTKSFYEGQADGSRRSADVIVPLVMGAADIRSVVDFGCGLGTWLEAFATAGIDDYLGIDGTYVDPAQLRISPAKFFPRDLSQCVRLDRRFDLACALEVAEHLPESAAEIFVASLADAAPRVLFSAAVPGQGGTNHINEQWQSYWAQRFAVHGYSTYDCVRPHVYGRSDVEYWYQQNVLLFCKPEAAPHDGIAVEDAYAIDRAHPQLVRNLELAPHSGRQAMTAIGRGLKILARKSTQPSTLKSLAAAPNF